MLEQPSRVLNQFDDSDAFCEKMAGWDLEFRQLDGGQADISLEVVIGHQVVVRRFAFGRRFHQMGIPPLGFLCFGVSIPDRLTWRGEKLGTSTLLNFNHADGFDSVSEPDFEGFEIAVPETMLMSTARNMAVCDLISNCLAGTAYFSVESSQLAEMIRLAERLASVVASGPIALQCLSEVEGELVAALVQSLSIALPAPGIGPNRRRQSVARVLNYLEGTSDLIQIGDLCQQAGTSWRSLDRAFKEQFGVTPKEYVTVDRLTRARRELLRADQAAQVSEIANNWGFSHLGRFAQLYRRQFGELPSQTLRLRSIR